MFYNNFSDVEDIISNYGIKDTELLGATIIYADYTYEEYTGSSYVLFWKDGKYYEVYGSHCSCYGLEDQWDPEEITISELMKLADRGVHDLQIFLDLKAFLKSQR